VQILSGRKNLAGIRSLGTCTMLILEQANASLRVTRQVFKKGQSSQNQGRTVSHKNARFRAIAIVRRAIDIGFRPPREHTRATADLASTNPSAQSSFRRNNCLNARSRLALDAALTVQCPSFRFGLGSLP